jgi:hypothetical protein
MDLGAGKLGWQGFAFGLPPSGGGLAGELRQFLGHGRQVGIGGFLEQLGLLGGQAFRLHAETITLVQRQLMAELIDLALASDQFPVLLDEQAAQGLGIQLVEVGRQRHASIMFAEAPNCHSGIPRWCTVKSSESPRHRPVAPRVGPAPAHQVKPQLAQQLQQQNVQKQLDDLKAKAKIELVEAPAAPAAK